jgi:NitT/TauT family transport system ATP-binding protein
MTDVILQVKDLEKTFQSRQGANHAIGGLSFDLRSGEFLVMVGPSGCGKTTLLRCVAGLLDVDSGERVVATGSRGGVPNSLSIVFQEYSRSLFPWLTVERNVAFGLDAVPRRERMDRVAEALNLVGLEQFSRHYPWQLSGGMQQRVAIARAVARRSALLLMDEPFASIDAQMRASLEDMIARLWAQLGFSVVFVTHDIDEAILLADRVLVLSDRPSHVLRELAIDLPRPRDQVDTKADPKFGAFRAEIFKLLSRTGEDPRPAVVHS